MDTLLWVGLAGALALIVAMSVWSGSRTKKSGEAKNGAPVVAGIIMGTLVGGSSTIGTAQLAFQFGLSAWWFTLGGSIACLILALIYADPLRRTGCPTLVGIIRREFGPTAGMTSSVLSAVGTFISIISQLISATAVIAVVAPALGIGAAVIAAALLMVLYVVFGGTKGAGIVGIVKTALLYVSMLACGAMVLMMTGGVSSFRALVEAIDNPEGVRFFSLFARGVGTDAGACLSLILGVLTTQTYAQGVLTAKNDRAGKLGAIASAFLIPPIGVGGILTGLYMRANASLYPGLTAKTALTTFITAHFHPLLAGVILGTLFVAVIGTGAGLALGISSIINNDIVKKITHRFDEPKKTLAMSRVWIVVVLAVACALSTGNLGDTILKFAFMSMGLRGTVVFVPLICALWLPGRISKKFALASIIISPIVTLLFGIMDILPFDSLFVGVIVSIIIMAFGYALGGKRQMSHG